MSQARLALLGATGAVGRALLEAMAELALPMASLRVFASAASAGEGVALGRRELDVEDTAEFVPADFDLVFHAASEAVDPVAAAALAAGCRVIDLGGRIHGAEHVHAPLASMLAVLLRGLPADVDHLTVTAMLPVVAAGRHGVDELAQQTMALFNQKSYEREVFDRQVAFNLIPQAGKIGPDGCSDSERALRLSALLRERGLLGTSITWFEQADGSPVPPEQYREYCMASVTTHDMPPTAGYLDAAHVRLQHQLGLLTEDLDVELAHAAREVDEWLHLLRERGFLTGDDPSTEDVVLAMHKFLMATPARMLCAALTDAVGDHRTQNQPGTTDEYPNWRVPLSGPDGKPMSLEDVFHSERALRMSAVMNGFVVPPTAHRSTSEFIIGPD